MSRRYDAILVDFYGTVADGDRHQVETTCGDIVRDLKLSLSAQDFSLSWGRNFFAVVDASNHDHFRTLYECECVSLRRTLAEFDQHCDPIPYVDQLQRYWAYPPLHGEAKKALARLSVPVCCVSNADHTDLLQAIQAHGLSFDAVVSSESARSYKPDTRIFQTALKTLGVSPERCLHVGDSLHSDIGGAQAAGITAVWIERDGRISDIGNAHPDHKINSLIELEHFLR